MILKTHHHYLADLSPGPGRNWFPSLLVNGASLLSWRFKKQKCFSLTILVPDPTRPSGRPSGFSSLPHAEPRQTGWTPGRPVSIFRVCQALCRLRAWASFARWSRLPRSSNFYQSEDSIPRDTPGSRAHTGLLLASPGVSLLQIFLLPPGFVCLFVGGWGEDGELTWGTFFPSKCLQDT